MKTVMLSVTYDEHHNKTIILRVSMLNDIMLSVVILNVVYAEFVN
jgi:hypothetical protein